MAAETEGLREEAAKAMAERDQIREVMREYEGVREQMEMADKTME